MASLSINAGSDFTVKAGDSSLFHGSASGGFKPYTIHWDFGDGQSATGSLTPIHAYANAGRYTATLKVTDAKKRFKSDSSLVTVTSLAPIAPTGLVAVYSVG